MNPNVEMGFNKFSTKPNPDFVVQVISEHQEEDQTRDNQMNDSDMIGKRTTNLDEQSMTSLGLH